MSHEILLRQLKLGSEDKPFVVVGVIRTEGPTAIKTGNKAIILSDGSIEGWVGGHCTEGEILRNAQECLIDGESRMLNLSTCQGGRMDVYLEPYLSKRKLVVFGHVPIVNALARMAKILNFSVSVVDRQATKDVFPEADAVFSTFEGFRANSTKESLGQMYAVVATMGERDQEYVQELSSLDLPYIGVIAGKKRASDLISYLRKSDVSEERLSRIKSPAGIFIRAVTAEEIALSLLAEIVELARTKSGDAQRFRLMNSTLGESNSEKSVPSKAGGVSSEKGVFVDPVCGMTVDSSSEYRVTLGDGRSIYFCCAGCKESFENGPENYILEELGR